jgi:hypothetical protein
MSRLTFVLCVLTACGGGTDHNTVDQRAATTFFHVYAALETVQQQALAAQPVAQSIDFSGSCSAGGTAAIHGTYDDGNGSGRPTYMFDVTLAACVDGTDTLDGQVHWTASVTGAGSDATFTETMDGSVAYEGADYAGTFAFHNITITTTVMGTSATVTVTGTYTIGGTTYTVDSTNWSALFGG